MLGRKGEQKLSSENGSLSQKTGELVHMWVSHLHIHIFLYYLDFYSFVQSFSFSDVTGSCFFVDACFCICLFSWLFIVIVQICKNVQSSLIHKKKQLQRKQLIFLQELIYLCLYVRLYKMLIHKSQQTNLNQIRLDSISAKIRM